MSESSAQEVEITVEGVITRLMPCAEHAKGAPGVLVTTGGLYAIGEAVPGDVRAVRNPNGFHHDCPECARTPTIEEELERTVTRHVF